MTGMTGMTGMPALHGMPAIHGMSALHGMPAFHGVPALLGIPTLHGMPAIHGMPDTVSFHMPAIGVKLLIGMKYRCSCFEIKLSCPNFLATTNFLKFGIEVALRMFQGENHSFL